MKILSSSGSYLLLVKAIALRLSDVKTLIAKELNLISTSTKLPDFFGKLMIDLTKFGPTFLLAPKNASLTKIKEALINSLKEKLLKVISHPTLVEDICSNMTKYFEHHFAVDYQEYLSQANPNDASMLLTLTDKLAAKTQDFLYFQKFILLQIDFLAAKIKKSIEASKKFNTEETVRIMIGSVIPWLTELSNFLYRAFDPYFHDFNEGDLFFKKTLVNQQLESPFQQRKMSAPLDPKVLESNGQAPEYINRTKSAKEQVPSKPKPVQDNTVTKLGPKELAMIKEFAAKKAKKGDNLYYLEEDLYMIQNYIQYNDIPEVESVTLPQKLLSANQRINC